MCSLLPASLKIKTSILHLFESFSLMFGSPACMLNNIYLHINNLALQCFTKADMTDKVPNPPLLTKSSQHVYKILNMRADIFCVIIRAIQHMQNLHSNKLCHLKIFIKIFICRTHLFHLCIVLNHSSICNKINYNKCYISIDEPLCKT